MAEEYGAGDTYKSAKRRESVAAVVPSIGTYSRGIESSGFADGVLVNKFLYDDGGECSPEGDHCRGTQFAAVEPEDERDDGFVGDAHCYGSQCETHDGGGQSFVFPVAVVVVAVGGLAADFDEEEHHGIGGEVRKRMDSIGSHSRAVAEDAGYELEDGQQDVGGGAYESDLVYLAFAVHECYSVRLTGNWK